MKNILRKKCLCFVTLFVIFLLFCAPVYASAAEIDICKTSSITILKGQTYQMIGKDVSKYKANAVVVTPSTTNTTGASGTNTSNVQDADDNTVRWASSDPTVVFITMGGQITAKKTGEATISGTFGDLKFSCRVTVNRLVTKVKLNKKQKELKAGKSYTLKATVKPTKYVNKTVNWTSSNKKIAKVNSKGKVTTVGVGTCTITATAADGSGKKAKCTFTVTEGTMKMSKEELTLAEGEKETLEAMYIDTKGVVWTSSDVNIAKVSAGGVVTGVAIGNAIITATKADGSTSVTCSVNVVEETQKIPGASLNASKFLALMKKYSERVVSDAAVGKYWKYSNSGTSSKWKTAAKKNRKINCALLARWGLREMGIIDSTNFWGAAGGSIVYRGNIKDQLEEYCTIIKAYKTPSQLEKEGNLKPGDICTWVELQHTNVYAGNGLWYDSGRGVNYESSTGHFKSFGPSTAMSMTSKHIGYIIRLN